MSAPDGFDEEGQAVDDASSDVARAWEKATEWVPADDPAPDAGDDWDADLGDDGRENPPDVPGAGLPDNCPVVPLGVQGRVYYFLDALKQLQEVPWKDLQRSVIVGLFGVGARDYLRRQ
ncbi:MAG TPA: hypothetical protein VLL76_00880, partial [Candidatus Omnitrophota bacterium]|nr:hypothetical protein [Candidatus Omnitrophota bacterium]